MTPAEISQKVIAQRAVWIREMRDALRDLHLEEKAAFLSDRHRVAAAESYLRR